MRLVVGRERGRIREIYIPLSTLSLWRVLICIFDFSLLVQLRVPHLIYTDTSTLSLTLMQLSVAILALLLINLLPQAVKNFITTQMLLYLHHLLGCRHQHRNVLAGVFSTQQRGMGTFCRHRYEHIQSYTADFLKGAAGWNWNSCCLEKRDCSNDVGISPTTNLTFCPELSFWVLTIPKIHSLTDSRFTQTFKKIKKCLEHVACNSLTKYHKNEKKSLNISWAAMQVMVLWESISEAMVSGHHSEAMFIPQCSRYLGLKAQGICEWEKEVLPWFPVICWKSHSSGLGREGPQKKRAVELITLIWPRRRWRQNLFWPFWDRLTHGVPDWFFQFLFYYVALGYCLSWFSNLLHLKYQENPNK